MKLSIGAFCLFTLLSSTGLAQEREKPSANFFLFAAPGVGHDTGGLTLEGGGGAEGYVYKGNCSRIVRNIVYLPLYRQIPTGEINRIANCMKASGKRLQKKH